MKARRILLAALVIAWALTPLALYFTALAPSLVHSGHRRVALACFVGSVAWFAMWLRALPAPQVPCVQTPGLQP